MSTKTLFHCHDEDDWPIQPVFAGNTPSGSLLTDPSPPCREQAWRRLVIILPALVVIFGAVALMLGTRGYLFGSDQDARSLSLQLVALAAALVVCPRIATDRLTELRGAVVHLLVAAALVVNSVSLAYGLVVGAPIQLAWLACAGLGEPRLCTRLRMLAPTVLLYGTLSLVVLPWRDAAFVLGCCAAGMTLGIPAGAAVRRAWRMQWLREQELLKTCRYDGLSGALSRNYLMEQAKRDLSLARRHGRPLSIAMLDLDHFKAVNDRHGHAIGDAVIRALVATCTATLRSTDYVGRIGGEEFICVMPETAPDKALACAERIREHFASQTVVGLPAGVYCTVSIGIAVYAGQADLDALLREADMALYRAKEAGRNCTVLSCEHRIGVA